MQTAHGVSVVRSYTAVGLAWATSYQDPVDWQVRDATAIVALNEMDEADPRWGVWKYIARLGALGQS